MMVKTTYLIWTLEGPGEGAHLFSRSPRYGWVSWEGCVWIEEAWRPVARAVDAASSRVRKQAEWEEAPSPLALQAWRPSACAEPPGHDVCAPSHTRGTPPAAEPRGGLRTRRGPPCIATAAFHDDRALQLPWRCMSKAEPPPAHGCPPPGELPPLSRYSPPRPSLSRLGDSFFFVLQCLRKLAQGSGISAWVAPNPMMGHPGRRGLHGRLSQGCHNCVDE